ncbi:MAG: linear amide C-N hydrolase [Clostridia bacterium]|nr:linear amide C-N hydrolase [Clostridia bacterium]
MCTAISLFSDSHYFGRNLDMEANSGAVVECMSIAVTPRQFPFSFSNGLHTEEHNAIIGTAYVPDDMPLYYDAVNEHGLAAAGLAFASSAYYLPKAADTSIAPYEVIPYVLSSCCTCEQVKACLQSITIADISYSDHLPSTPLHWIFSDGKTCLVAEPCHTGLMLYDAPVGVLANDPPFPNQMDRLRDYRSLSPNTPNTSFSEALSLGIYSRGMGAIGLPGDLSSASRFVRAAYARVCSNIPAADIDPCTTAIAHLFRLLSFTAQPYGCVITENNTYEYTVYTCGCDATQGIYCYTTYQSPSVHVVRLRDYVLSSSKVTTIAVKDSAAFHSML